MIPWISRSLNACRDVLGDACTSALVRPIRVFLLAGIFAVGVGGFVAARNINETAANQITQRLSPTALDQVFAKVSLNDSTAGPTNSDYLIAGAARIEHVRHVGVERSIEPAALGADIRHPLAPTSDISLPPTVFAVTPGWFGAMEIDVTPANAVEIFGSTITGHSVILGKEVALDIGITSAGPGRQIWLAGRPFDVVGIVEHAGRKPLASRSAFVHSSTADELFPSLSGATDLVLRTAPGAAHGVAAVIPFALRPDRPGAVEVNTTLDPTNLRRGVETDLDQLILVSSFLMLAFSTIAIANVIYASVIGRSGEIGLRRALGARRRQIVGLILVEGSVIGFLGAASGVGIGIFGSILVASIKGWEPVVSLSSAYHGLVVGSIAGTAAALWPSFVAARTDPAVSLRSRV